MPPEAHITSDSDLESVISTQEPAIKSRRNSAPLKYVCTTEGCGASFKRLTHLDRHEFKHTGIKKHICLYDGCDKAYTIVTHLKRHLATTHERVEPSQKNLRCTVEGCDKLFSLSQNLQRHIREVHENPKIYYCSHCNEKFTQKLKMRRHEITQHTGVYPYTCAKCDKGFFQEWQCVRHNANCQIYSCSGCSAQFEKWSMYQKHCKETHHGRQYYNCEHCTRSYARPGELQRHVAIMHTKADVAVLPHKCPHEGCDRQYAYERNLTQHLRTKHQGQLYKCTTADCRRTFSSANNLNRHLQREHESVEAKTKQPKVLDSKSKPKMKRKKRKDAGRPVMSHLAQLSGLSVDRNSDKLLRDREETVLTEVLNILTNEADSQELEQSETNAEQDAVEEEVRLRSSKKRKLNEKESQTK